LPSILYPQHARFQKEKLQNLITIGVDTYVEKD
ncbi:hypothetical protein SAMN05878494_5329, partial [Bacillus cereus]